MAFCENKVSLSVCACGIPPPISTTLSATSLIYLGYIKFQIQILLLCLDTVQLDSSSPKWCDTLGVKFLFFSLDP